MNRRAFIQALVAFFGTAVIATKAPRVRAEPQPVYPCWCVKYEPPPKPAHTTYLPLTANGN